MPLEEQTQTTPQMQDSHSKRMMYIILIIVFIFAVLSLASLYITSSVQKPTAQNQHVTTAPSQANTLAPQETTTNTASSLEMPPRYPKATWEEVTTPSDTDKLNIIVASNKTTPFLEVPLTGYTLATTQEGRSTDIETYYATELEKKGWSVNGSRIQFTTFALQGLFADGPCGGIAGYVGVKDSFVKTVTIEHQTVPCSGPNAAANIQVSTSYKIFFSESISVQQITDYIKTHSTK